MAKYKNMTHPGNDAGRRSQENQAIAVAFADLPATDRRERVLRDLMRPSRLKPGATVVVRTNAEREEAIREIIGLQGEKLAQTAEEGVQLRGPLVLALADSALLTSRLKAFLSCLGQPLLPVEVGIPWRYRARAVEILERAGFATELESGALDGLAVIEGLARHDPDLLKEIRIAHDQLWHVPRIAGLHGGVLDHLLLQMSQDALLDWAGGGFAAIFAHPFVFATRPERRRKLIQQHRPRLVVHDELAAEELRAIEAFAPTRLLLARQALA